MELIDQVTINDLSKRDLLLIIKSFKYKVTIPSLILGLIVLTIGIIISTIFREK